MSAPGALVSLNGAERSRYEALFITADGDKDGVIGPADAAWFLTLGLDKTTLSEVTPSPRSLDQPPPQAANFFSFLLCIMWE